MNSSFPDRWSFSYLIFKWFLTAVRQEVNNLHSSVVVHELEFAMQRGLSGRLRSLGN